MAKFGSIVKGKRARKTVELPLVDGQVATLAVVPLLDSDDDIVDTKAREYAKARGVDDPKAGDPIYDRGHTLHTLLLACVDAESPVDAPVPFFDSVGQISDNLDRDRIAWLLTAQQAWEDECSPRQLKMTTDEYVAFVWEAATTDDLDRFFTRLRPGLAAICMRSMAAQLLNAPELRWLSGLEPSDTSTTTSSQSPS